MKITVWQDYGSEGWIPKDFEQSGEALDYIRSGSCMMPWRLTQDVGLTVQTQEILEASVPYYKHTERKDT